MKRVFFTDRDLGKRFPEILAAAGLSVERHHELFQHDCPDEEWLRYVGERERVAVTHDQRIRYKPNERDAVIRYGARLLVLVGKAPYPQLARSFVATLPRIESFLDAHVPPWIAKVYRASEIERAERADAPGSVSLWFPARV